MLSLEKLIILFVAGLYLQGQQFVMQKFQLILTLSAGTTICNAKISIDIISVNQKSTKKDFTISVNGNGVSESQAKENAQQLLINKYSSEYSSL